MWEDQVSSLNLPTYTKEPGINPNPGLLSNLSSLSNVQLTPQERVVPLTPLPLDQPCQTTPVTLPGQRFHMYVGPALMT